MLGGMLHAQPAHLWHKRDPTTALRPVHKLHWDYKTVIFQYQFGLYGFANHLGLGPINPVQPSWVWDNYYNELIIMHALL